MVVPWGNVTITDPVAYFGQALLFTLLIRAVMSVFKTAAVRQGEADAIKKGKRFSNKSRYVTFRRVFLSCGHDMNLDDYWIPSILGALELLAYPILIACNAWTIIGAWIGIKTTIHWARWKESRTPYNRYLLGTVLAVIISAVFLTKFIKIERPIAENREGTYALVENRENNATTLYRINTKTGEVWCYAERAILRSGDVGLVGEARESLDLLIENARKEGKNVYTLPYWEITSERITGYYTVK